MISSPKELKGPQRAAREGDMSRVPKPVVCYLNAKQQSPDICNLICIRSILTGFIKLKFSHIVCSQTDA